MSETIHCPICSTGQKLIDTGAAEAWECVFCTQRWWVDDQARLEYMVFHGKNTEEADADLKEANGPLFGIVNYVQ
jgi:hypothetical protein